MARAEAASPGHLGQLRSAVDWFRQELELRGWAKPGATASATDADAGGGDGDGGAEGAAGSDSGLSPRPAPRARLTRLLSAIDDPSVAADAAAQPADDEVVAATALVPPTVCSELVGQGGVSGRVANASDAAHAVAVSPAHAPMRQLLAAPDDGAWRARDAYGTSEGTPGERERQGDDLSAEERWLLSRCPIEHVALGWANFHLATATVRGRVRVLSHSSRPSLRLILTAFALARPPPRTAVPAAPARLSSHRARRHMPRGAADAAAPIGLAAQALCGRH